MNDKPRTIALVGSSGGHLTQLLALAGWYADARRVWVTFDTPDATSQLQDEEHVIWGHRPTTRNIPNLLRNTALAWRILRRERPDVVISTGAGLAIPFFVLGWLFGIRTIYMEVYDRIDTASLTGRVVYPFTDVFLLQWPEQQTLYPRGTVVGRVL